MLALIAMQVARADFEAGQAAWDAGDFFNAVEQWRAGAHAGEVGSMLALGRLYRTGIGVLQDDVTAYMWLNLAASRGGLDAARERDRLAAMMTTDARAEGQRLARAWKPSGAAPVTVAPPQEAIREAQNLLAALGYRPGPADGLWGVRSTVAYQHFLRDAGLPASDALTPDGLLAMRAIAEDVESQPDFETNEVSSSNHNALATDAFHHAVRTGDIDEVRAALAVGTDMNARDGSGWTVLMHAANEGHLLLVEMLLAAGVEVDVRAPSGVTALSVAATLGNPEIVALLMKAGADFTIEGPNGQTAVEAAQTMFGDAVAATEAGENPAVVALLRGMALTEADAKPLLTVGETFRDCASCPEMVVLPTGSFVMGSPAREEGRDEDEGPQHHVEIRYSLAIGKYEVTFAEWDICVASGGCGEYRPDDWGWGRGDHPVIEVSWRDAQSYVHWLSRETGEDYRLLSEAEWEYAARAGTTGPFHTGKTVSKDEANFSSFLGFLAAGFETVPVGSFPANAYGLHDMHGNVYEWVEDCWNNSYHGAPSDGSAWQSGDCSQRMMRGGSMGGDSDTLRSANRNRDGMSIRNYNDVGLRVARIVHGLP
ncbi:MAG: SUMF1/EgtB/PvdO family nonheme iron enzyme [Rhodospirillaceae bacterium]|nr:SUMF1/EgtB/PvdO family nonheme iron enzyme [Rhodospirillaceae bacterium]